MSQRRVRVTPVRKKTNKERGARCEENVYQCARCGLKWAGWRRLVNEDICPKCKTPGTPIP